MKNIWKIITGIAIILGLMGGVYAIDDRYAKERRVAQSLEQFQEQTQQSIKQLRIKVQLQFYQMMYDSLTKDMISYKRMMRENPNNQDIKDEYNRIIDERNQIRIKINKLMEQIDG